ncbi:uncharacterized protein Dvir_GJ25871 [Drosophila virilis]|uniref:Uncharacterized protein n=1 Tax=Drosophila virilis TaxID=7244 RepID=A0A0Q9WDD2_DROVI|nr:uncharacterized protein LOC26530641 [Drosophila virilis]KRF79215.1 uncharacterized protein Dvir_GJ25871 [Drosophila virilis]
MCLCESCECMDNLCCSLKAKAMFFSIWTLVNGVISILVGIFLKAETSVICLCYALIVLHILAGILLLLGVLKHWAKIFLAGIILSSFLPYMFLFLPYLAVVQVIFTITSCRYYMLQLK